jgi:hypothetical protein
MVVWERNALFGGARGPPGIEGLFGIFTGRAVELAGGVFVRCLVPDEEREDAGLAVPGFSRLPDILAFRPREAKNTPALEVGVGGIDLMEEVGVPLARDEDRTGKRWL